MSIVKVKERFHSENEKTVYYELTSALIFEGLPPIEQLLSYTITDENGFSVTEIYALYIQAGGTEETLLSLTSGFEDEDYKVEDLLHDLGLEVTYDETRSPLFLTFRSSLQYHAYQVDALEKLREVLRNTYKYTESLSRLEYWFLTKTANMYIKEVKQEQAVRNITEKTFCEFIQYQTNEPKCYCKYKH